MKKHSPFLLLGFVMVLLSLVLLIGSGLLNRFHQNQTTQLVRQIESLLPQARTGSPQDYSSSEMPVLQLEGQEFSALIRIPSFGVTLPMGSSWDSGDISRYPCRFWGSMYDGSLVIGGKDQKGQLDFFPRLDLGERIIVTDMTGVQFHYTVSRISRSKHADSETLITPDWDLTLFVRDATSLDYILVRCSYS